METEPTKNEHEQLRELVLENQRLIAENHKMLNKLRRAAVWGFWLRVAWVAVFIGLPFIVYYYILEPYFDSFGSSIQTFQQGLQEIPGWKQFYENRQ